MQRESLFAVVLLIASSGIHAQVDASEIRGRLLNRTGQPLSRAQMRVLGTDHSAIAEPDGSYRIRDLEAGVYDLEARAGGFYAVTIKGVRLGAGEIKPLPSLVVDAEPVFDCAEIRRPDYYRPSSSVGAGGIGGVVTTDKNAIGENATITLYLKGKGKVASTITDAKGRFSFSALQPSRAEYWITVVHEGAFAEEVPRLDVQPGFEAVYDPITLKSCSPGRCQPHLKPVRVIPPCG